MPLLPKRVKYRKSQRGSRKGFASRNITIDFGSYALQTLDRAWITNVQIEAARGIFLVLKSAEKACDSLALALQEHCKQKLAPYKFPRWIEFRLGDGDSPGQAKIQDLDHSTVGQHYVCRL